MNLKSIPIVDVVLAAVCGVVAVISIIPFSFAAVMVFAVATFIRVRSGVRSEDASRAAAVFVVPAFVFSGIIVAAAVYRPTKIVEQQLQRQVKIPSTQMTLAELSYLAAYDRQSFPIPTSLCLAEDDKETVITFSSRDLTLGKFLETLESQTVLRRRFMHCGNGYTVLAGGDCSFGLYVRDPELAVPPFPRERFDLDAYAQVRDRLGTRTR